MGLFSVGCGGNIGGDEGGGGGTEVDAGNGGGGGGGGGAADASTCARIQLDLSEQIPTVMVLVDRSGSMTAGFGNTNRWDATYETLMDPTTGVIKQLEGRVRFGAALYTSIGGSAGTQSLEGQPAGTCPMISQVAPALNNHGIIDAMYSSKDPVTDTPTGASIVKMKELLEPLTEPGPKVIVLATDGLPDSCSIANPANDAERLQTEGEAITAAQDAFAVGIETHIISVGDAIGDAHLQDMANAGVGLAVGGNDNAPFYKALNPDQLIAAFDQIIAGVRTCVFTLDGQVDPNRASEGTVTFDGNLLQEGTDWRLNDESTLELLGGVCDQLLDGGEHSLNAEFECTAIID